ncbi:MAG: hypothetical protein JF597_19275 [Streptomyces sp.]|uniref:hypothetical protein n=1 Tax=Streptomyces sp. TaxID=1931 RepID=UPI0025E960F9|nr:hypothetical protein [Streptomyces sp.]MBW8795650.1 hypothetical protein [Streptomyces sp.]
MAVSEAQGAPRPAGRGERLPDALALYGLLILTVTGVRPTFFLDPPPVLRHAGGPAGHRVGAPSRGTRTGVPRSGRGGPGEDKWSEEVEP